MIPTKVDWRMKEGALCAFVGDRQVTWAPQPGSQVAFISSPIFETLYEGTRGPGKTDALLMSYAQYVGKGFGEAWRGILFRQTYKQLGDVKKKSKKWFPKLFPNAQWKEGDHEWHFPDGEVLLFRHMERKADYDNYHGHEYPWIGFEELTNWSTPDCYTIMFSCCRSTFPGIPKMIRATTNPSGKGHNWVKHRFQLPVKKGRCIGRVILDEATGKKRVAIRGKLAENKILLASDPGYRGTIAAAATSEAQLKAWLDGDWDITSGGMFDDIWNTHAHVLEPFQIPHNWRIDRSFDWGSSKPFSVGWWAQSDGSDVFMPGKGWTATVAGDLFRIGEWYGWTGNQQKVEGLRLLATDITKGIIEREIDMGIYGRVKPGPADSSIFDVENGVCIANDMKKKVRLRGKMYKGVRWRKADKSSGSRKLGWMAIRQRLKGSISENNLPREFPGLFVFEDCLQFIRTVPVLPRSDKDPDDADTDAEDHIADDVRYRVRSKGEFSSDFSAMIN